MCKNNYNGNNVMINMCGCCGGSGIAKAEVAVGTVIAYMGLTAPDGYLIMDGTEYYIADYLILAEHFENQMGMKNYFGGDGAATFALPDARGEFLRGYDPEHIRDSVGDKVNRGIGKHQDGTLFPNTYSTNAWVGALYKNQSHHGIENADSFIDISDGINYYNNPSKNTEYNEKNRVYSRPTNINVLYCIKY